MTLRARLLSSLAAVAVLAAPLAGIAQPQGQGDAMMDPTMKREAVIAFIGLKPGDKVADIVGGRFLRALSVAVGPKGHVYGVETAEVLKAHPEIMGQLKPMTDDPKFANVSLSTDPVATALPGGLDAVFIRQNYHDLYDKFMGPADVAAFNKAVYAALKPGGVYVILDHAAAAGAPMTVTETLHRIDPAVVKADMAKAGLVYAPKDKPGLRIHKVAMPEGRKPEPAVILTSLACRRLGL